MIRTTLLAAALLAGAAGAAHAAINKDAGSSAGQFLKLGAGARAGGMADSFSAIADDVHAAYYNPAGLAQLTGPQIAGAHTSFIMDVNYEVLDFAYPWGRQEDYSKHTVAVGIFYLSAGLVERRATDTTENIGSFDATDGSYGVSYAYGFNNALSFGVTAKLVSQRIDTHNSDAVAGDAGLLYRINPDGRMPMSMSLVMRNWGTRVSYANGTSDPLPVSGTLGLGAQMFSKRLLVNVEGTKYRDTGLYGAVGAEYIQPFGDKMKAAMRAGYTSHYKDLAGLNGMTMGTGLTFNVISFDFAWVPFGRLGDTFRYSLMLKF